MAAPLFPQPEPLTTDIKPARPPSRETTPITKTPAASKEDTSSPVRPSDSVSKREKTVRIDVADPTLLYQADLYRKRLDSEAEYAAAYYRYQIRLMDYNVGLFMWHQTAASVILWLACAVVAAGVLFSAIQLGNALRLSQPQASTELEVSAQKVRITSSVIGIVVLAMSLMFVYLFVHEIYGIKPITMTGASRGQETSR